MQTQNEKEALVAKLTVMDDVLFEKVVEDKDTCQEMLQVFMQDPTIKIISNTPQMHIRNIGSKSIVMDLLCTSKDRTHFAIEMQKADDDDHIKRVRYNASNIDTRFAEKGIDYKELSDIYMIYITKNDFLHGNKTVYHVERRLAETGQLVYNGINEIYINAKIEDGSEIAGLMKLIKSTGYHDDRFPHMSNRIHYFKHTNEGVRKVCDLVEEYAKKRADEVIKKSVTMLRNHGIKDAEIVNDIMENFQLTREAALSYM